jgi:hypothetical protein
MINEEVINELREYLKDHYTPELLSVRGNIEVPEAVQCFACLAEPVYTLRDISDDASDYIKKHKKPGGFAHTLDKIREEKGLAPAELYKRANIDRRQYSRYMGPEGRHPSMNTVICFALALNLNRQEFDNFLQTAGYALSNSSSRDVCIMFCLEKSIYSVDDVNALLFSMGLEPLNRDV